MNELLSSGRRWIFSSHLVELLKKKNSAVYVFDNHSGNLKFRTDQKATFILGDITNEMDLEKLNRYPKFDGVFHLAAKNSVSESIINAGLYENVNIQGTQNLLKYCLSRKIANIVFTSSAAVYGESESSLLIKESASTQPINPYGVTKLQGENMIELASRSEGISGFSLRVFNIVGASKSSYFDKKGENVIPIMLNSLLLQNPFTIFGKNFATKDGSCVRDYVNVSDVAKAHIKAMENLHNSPKGTYEKVNISSGFGTSTLELVSALNSLSVEELKWRFGDERVGDPASVIGANELAYDVFG